MATVTPDATSAGGYNIAPVSEIAPEWRDAFIAACSKWKDFDGFVRDGGVPGCRVPPFGPKLLSRWWALGSDGNDAHDPRPRAGSVDQLAALASESFMPDVRAYYAESDVHDLIDADAAYNPDY